MNLNTGLRGAAKDFGCLLEDNREKHTVEEFVEGLSHFDKEGNGLINVAELRHLLTTLGERLTDEEVDQLLAGHNDSHGNVNIADFVRNVMNS
ncbi:EF hand [Teladorsagia circumcincta]|uniref:Myosin-2 essential light chain n=1 Tax=Teladorsagia circumcincta TaxID=45464 RepID=A0A2G9T334_TELCI|nr:EF hand [Teladorsagia circumcincta]